MDLIFSVIINLQGGYYVQNRNHLMEKRIAYNGHSQDMKDWRTARVKRLTLTSRTIRSQ